MSDRREAAAVALALKMLSGSCNGLLNQYTPETFVPREEKERFSRHTLPGIQIRPTVKSNSLVVPPLRLNMESFTEKELRSYGMSTSQTTGYCSGQGYHRG